jgi:hypothetical protein
LAIVGTIDAGLAQQVEMDLASFTRATGRMLPDREVDRYRAVQQRSYRETFLTSGMRYSQFQALLATISPEAVKAVAEVASVLVPHHSN